MNWEQESGNNGFYNFLRIDGINSIKIQESADGNYSVAAFRKGTQININVENFSDLRRAKLFAEQLIISGNWKHF